MLKVATKFAPRESAFETAFKAGFRFAEFWLDTELLARWQQICQMASDYPLQYVPHFPNRAKMAQRDLENSVSLYRTLDCRAMVIHSPMFEQFAEPLLSLDPELCLAVENHRLKPDRFRRWADQFEFLTLDVEHVWKFTLDDCPLPELLEFVQKFLDSHGSKLRHVHLPGYVPGRREHRPMNFARDLVHGMFDLLANIDYQGFIVSEVGPEFQTETELRLDILLFQSWREQHAARQAE